MAPRMLRAFFVVLAAATVAASPLKAPQTQSIDVSVTDKAGAPIPGLAPGDFILEVDGKRVQTAAVASAVEPIQVAVVFSGKQPEGIREFADVVFKANAASVVAVTVSGDPSLAAFSSDVQTIAAQLAGRTSLVGPTLGVEAASRSFSAFASPRPFIVAYLNEEQDDGPSWGTPASQERSDEEAARVRELHVQVWTLVTPHLGSNDAPTRSDGAIRLPPETQAHHEYSEMSASSGGMMLLTGTSSAETTASFVRFAKAITSEYRVSFVAPGGAGPSSKLRVSVKRSGAHVAAPDHWSMP